MSGSLHGAARRVATQALVLLVASSAACFDPTPSEGLACSASGACPIGQECVVGTCYLPGNAPSVDAAIDAAHLRCTTESLASGQDSATALDVSDPSYVYWTASTGTLVLRSPKLRGPLEVFHDAGAGRHPYGVAVDSTHVYWTESDAAGRLMRKPLASAPTDAAQELATGQGEPVHLAVDATHVYWSNLASGTVSRVPKAGGSPELLATSQAAPNFLRLADGSVYWLNTGAGQVMRADKAGPPLQQLAGGQNQPGDLAVRGDTVVWTDSADGALRSVGTGGGPVQSVATGQDAPLAILLTDDYIVWSNPGSGEVLAAARPFGVPEAIADAQSGALSLAQDGTQLYWLNSLDQANRLVRASCDSL